MPVELSFSYAHRLDIYDEFLTSESPAAFAAVSEDEIAAARKSERVFTPQRPEEECEKEYERWLRAVERAKDWAEK